MPSTLAASRDTKSPLRTVPQSELIESIRISLFDPLKYLLRRLGISLYKLLPVFNVPLRLRQMLHAVHLARTLVPKHYEHRVQRFNFLYGKDPLCSPCGCVGVAEHLIAPTVGDVAAGYKTQVWDPKYGGVVDVTVAAFDSLEFSCVLQHEGLVVCW